MDLNGVYGLRFIFHCPSPRFLRAVKCHLGRWKCGISEAKATAATESSANGSALQMDLQAIHCTVPRRPEHEIHPLCWHVHFLNVEVQTMSTQSDFGSSFVT